MARNDTQVRPEGVYYTDENGNKILSAPLSGGGYKIVDNATGKVIEEVGQKKRARQIKRNLSGGVVFAGAGTDRGTTTNITGANNPTLTASLTNAPAQFVKAICKMGTTFTAGTVYFKFLDGANTATTKTLVAADVAATTTTTATDLALSDPKVIFSNTGLGGGTITTATLTMQLNALETPTIPLV